MSETNKVQTAQTALDVARQREYELKSALHTAQSTLVAAREVEALAAGVDDEAKLRKASKAVDDAVEAVRVKQLQVDAATKRVSEANAALHDAKTDALSAELDQRFTEGSELVRSLHRDLFKCNSSIAAVLSYLRKVRADYRSAPQQLERAQMLQRLEGALKNAIVHELSAMPLMDSRESADLAKILAEFISATKDAVHGQPVPAVVSSEPPSVDFIDGALRTAVSEVEA